MKFIFKILWLKESRAFTLIELVLYLGIVSFMVVIITVFYGLVLQARVKNQVMLEVNSQGAYVMQMMAQSVRNAQDVNLPVAGGSGDVLSLQVSDSAKDPTVFDLLSGVLRVKEGVGSEVDITSSRVVVSDLLFKNLSQGTEPSSVQISFLLSSYNPEGRNEYEYGQVFYGTANVRNN